MVLIVQIIGKILFWFGLGIILKTKLATGLFGKRGIKLANYVDSLTFIELFIILFTIFFLFSIFSQILFLNLLDIYLVNQNLSRLWRYFYFMVETNSTSTADYNVNNLNPNNYSTFVGKSELINLFKQVFGLSDNLIICYLELIDLLHNVQVLSLIGLIFNLIIYSINLGLLEIKLNKFISSKTIINYIIRYLRYIQKSSLVMIICLLLLLVVSTYLTTLYFNFFLVNFDKICKIIIKL